MVTESGVGSAKPWLSVTVRLKVSTSLSSVSAASTSLSSVSTSGAVKVGWAALGSLNVTEGLPVWLHAYVNGVSSLGSELFVPSRVTVSP